MADIVMVAGGWHGGWAFTPIARELRARGHEVFTPTLTGLGERSHLAHAAVNLQTHIEDVVNVVLFERLTDIILCGHSYAGMVITGVADGCPSGLRAWFTSTPSCRGTATRGGILRVIDTARSPSTVRQGTGLASHLRSICARNALRIHSLHFGKRSG